PCQAARRATRRENGAVSTVPDRALDACHGVPPPGRRRTARTRSSGVRARRGDGAERATAHRLEGRPTMTPTPSPLTRVPRRSTASSGRTILVVDDQLDALTGPRSLLEHEGHRVLIATSAPAALAVLEREPVQVVLVDAHMPGDMTSDDLVHRVRER